MAWTHKEDGEWLKSVLKTIRDWYAARDIDLNFSLQEAHVLCEFMSACLLTLSDALGPCSC